MNRDIWNILSNKNRRQILKLLSLRPYYVNEIIDFLNVAPKAIISHLNALENAGLIKSDTNNQRRKYYTITKSLHLEIIVSPYLYNATINSFQNQTIKKISNQMNVYNSIEDIHTQLINIKNKIELISNKKKDLQLKHESLMRNLITLLEKNSEDEIEYKILLQIFEEERSTSSLIYNLKIEPTKLNQKLDALEKKGLIIKDFLKNESQWRFKY